jgi:lipopolysaccharide transport system ATP-binding protein
MNNIHLNIKNLSKKYELGTFGMKSFINQTFNKGKNLNEFQALDDINLKIFKGEKIGLIGPNGSGKSTLLKILSRVTNPTNGTAEIYGKISSVLEAGAAFHPDLTCLDNIFLTGAVLGMSRKRIHEKLNEIIEFSEIKKFIDTPVKRLSTGMNIKLAFSICAFLDGEILLLDEILAVADEKFRVKAIDFIIKNSSASNKTVIFVSHDLRNINQFCEKVILLDKGKLVKFGNTKEVLEYYS